MFGFGKKSAPLFTLIVPLEELYDYINQKIADYMNSGGLSLEDLESGNILKKYIEPKAFSYVILIWGIQLSKLGKAEKQLLCSSLTNKIGKQLSTFSENDGADYLRYSLVSYGKESENGSKDQLTHRIAFKFMSNMEVNPVDHMAAFGALSTNLKELINLPADFLDKQQQNYKFI